MYDLETLKENQEQVLLAEMAALLHNIGKLDPNAEMLEYSREELEQNYLYVQDYQFKRFAKPDPALIRQTTGGQEAQESEHSDKITLPAFPLDALDRQKVLSAKPPEIDEELWINEVADAANKFNRFVDVKGPLYRCFTQERKCAREEVIRRIGALESEIAEAKQRNLGPKIGELYNEKNRLETVLRNPEPSQEIYDCEQAAQTALEGNFRKFLLRTASETWSLPDLLTLFWDDFYWKPRLEDDEDADYKRVSLLEPWLKQSTHLPALLILSHGEVSGVEKSTPDEKIQAAGPTKPTKDNLRLSTAFGYESEKLDIWNFHTQRHRLLGIALKTCSNIAQRKQFIKTAQQILSMGAGDTRRPVNEINLWDYAASIATLFKSGMARTVLTGEIPSVDDMHWRFLSVRFDGLSYFAQAHHVTDLIGRRDILTKSLNAVKQLLEETYPFGNQVYRDENGAIFIVPDLPDQGLLKLSSYDKTLKDYILTTFAEAAEEKHPGTALAGELVPQIVVGEPRRGKQLNLGAFLQQQSQSVLQSAQQVAKWWHGAQVDNQEICTVCGLRPVGYKPPKAKMDDWVKAKKARQRHVCCVCLERRGRRAKEWLTKTPKQTIWADEVVDGNGRFALLVGKFDLALWLDGTLVRTLDIKPGTSKNPSPARTRRVWETTHRFWQEVQERLIPGQVGSPRPRLVVQADNTSELADKLGKYHTYELVVAGQTLSVVWDPVGKELILIEYLRDLARRLSLAGSPWQPRRAENGAKESMEDVEMRTCEAVKDWLDEHTDASGWPLQSPSGYNRPAHAEDVRVQYIDAQSGCIEGYIPHIRLLTEPGMFMALVPANQALTLAKAIHHKYECEMHKVQDRLPMHIGVVIAPRRTPMRVILEAGQAMAQRPASRWEAWEVKQRQRREKSEAPGHLSEANGHFETWWEILMEPACPKTALRPGSSADVDCCCRIEAKPYLPHMALRIGAKMGDGETEDVWYSHLLSREPQPGEIFEDDRPWKSPAALKPDDVVHIAASTFDFQFLDTTARRFAIAYDAQGRRRDYPTRPYTLAEVENLEKVWRLIARKLKNSQWMALDGLIEAKRQAWDEPYGVGGCYSDAFTQFVCDSLRNAEWKWKEQIEGKEHPIEHRGWHSLESRDQKLLERAAVHGMLHDVINLYHEAMKVEEAE